MPLQDFLFESAAGARYLNYSFGCPFGDTVVDKLTVKVCICFAIYITCFCYFKVFAKCLQNSKKIDTRPITFSGCPARGIKGSFRQSSFPS